MVMIAMGDLQLRGTALVGVAINVSRAPGGQPITL